VALRLDVTDRASVDEAVATAAVELGGLDVVVNVAGGDLPHGVFEETGDEIWSALLELNLVGVARVCRAAIPFLRRSSRSPAIVTVSSINAQAALGSEPYSSAKAGLTSLTANLARYLAPDGIRVNAVAPGTIRTRVWDSQEGGADRMLPLYPLDRVGEPGDVAAAVAFLGSVDAAWITVGWSALDYAVEWRSWSQRLKMTKQEIKDEAKESNGNPHTKGRIRNIQRAMRKRRVQADVSKATVVITNPTHYAVALAYDQGGAAPPRIVAKGVDAMAARIREAAAEHGVPLVPNPPLARALWRLELDTDIPAEHWQAVAEIIAYVLRLRRPSGAAPSTGRGGR
jgi:NADP-dependent 3-hydroxy acid dehydrogenase YdfG/type III secretion system FlhB-like substrate exporter